MLKVKRVFGTIVALMGLVLVVGCGGSGTSNDLPTQDRAGIDFVVPDNMEAIVSLAPSITMTLIDLGLEDRIVAMDTQSAWIVGNPNDLPVFDMMEVEVESLIELDPDFVFATGITMMDSEDNDPFGPLRELGIGVAYIPSANSMEGIQEDLRFMAVVTGTEDVAEQLIAEMDRELEEIAALVADSDVTPTVYFEIAPAPEMFSFGSGVFSNELIELAGGVNVFADQEGWLPVEAESVVDANPDVIFTSVNFIENPMDEIMDRPGWEAMSAISNGRVYFVDSNDTSIPTHRIVAGIRAMAEYLHN